MTDAQSGVPRCENCGQFKNDVKEIPVSEKGGFEGYGDFDILPPEEETEKRCEDCSDLVDNISISDLV